MAWRSAAEGGNQKLEGRGARFGLVTQGESASLARMKSRVRSPPGPLRLHLC